MKYRLRSPDNRTLKFDTYQQMLAALQPFRRNLDGLIVEELDSKGNVHATLDNAELRQIVAELDGIVLPTVQLTNQKDT